MIRTIDVHIKFPKDLQYLTPKEVLGKTLIMCVRGNVATLALSSRPRQGLTKVQAK
jgi:hypothetical protein